MNKHHSSKSAQAIDHAEARDHASQSNNGRRLALKAGGAFSLRSLVPASALLAAADPVFSAVAPVDYARPEAGVQLRTFAYGAVQLTASRWLDAQNRRMTYLRVLDMNRLLFNFRATAGLSTLGAANLQGWEVEGWGIRGHTLGHYLSGAAYAVAQTNDATLRNNLSYLIAELAKCQNNAVASGARAGYLGGFPQSDYDRLDRGDFLVPWYTHHKIMAGLLDVYRWTGNDLALTILLNFADWVDWRTGRLSYAQMQAQLGIEFGGMNDVLAELAMLTNNNRWLTVARRFDHAEINNPLANNVDDLAWRHANTQCGKVNGSMREYLASGNTRDLAIARNFFEIVRRDHTYATGGNSIGEFFRPPRQISHRLDWSTVETCNVYNMLKLAKDLFRLDPSRADYMDYYEHALFNQILAQQDTSSPTGRVTYFQDLRPGGSKVYDNEYNTFWCCTGTSFESFTKFNDSIYFSAGRTLYVNLFIPSALNWTAQGLTITQTTAFPASNTTTLRITGSASAALRIRIPGWTAGATIAVNGVVQNMVLTPGTYATIDRAWANGDQVVLTVPMPIQLRSSPDDPAVQAIFCGPVLLAGSFGAATSPAVGGGPPPAGPQGGINQLPRINPASIAYAGAPLRFTVAADIGTVQLKPYYDAHNEFYTVYWMNTTKSAYFQLANVGSGLLLGVDRMSMADGANVLQWDDNGMPDHEWEIVPAPGGYVRLRNRNSGKVLGVLGMSTSAGANVIQWGDNGTPDHDWILDDMGNGYVQIRNRNSNLLLGIAGTSLANGGLAVQLPAGAGVDRLWRIAPVGLVRLQNANSGLVLGIGGASGDNGAGALQWYDSGTPDHGWQFIPDANGYFRIRNLNSFKMLGIQDISTAAGAPALQWDDNGSADQRWRLRPVGDGMFRLQAFHSGMVLGIANAGTAVGGAALQWYDNGAADHNWRIV